MKEPKAQMSALLTGTCSCSFCLKDKSGGVELFQRAYHGANTNTILNICLDCIKELETLGKEVFTEISPTGAHANQSRNR